MDAPKAAQERYDGEEVDADRIAPDPDRAARWGVWHAENAEAIVAANRRYEREGHPLAKYMILPIGAV